MSFEFLDLGILDGGDFELVCVAKDAGDPERELVPAYDFKIRVNGVEFVGQVKLRIGMNDRDFANRHWQLPVISLFLPTTRAVCALSTSGTGVAKGLGSHAHFVLELGKARV